MSDQEVNDPTAHERLRAVVSRQPYPLIFATISGATCMASLRPIRITTFAAATCCRSRSPSASIPAGRRSSRQGRGGTRGRPGDARRPQVLRAAAQEDGYVLEQLYSPAGFVLTTPEHEELNRSAADHTNHNFHYRGFAEAHGGCSPGTPRRVKPLLYVYRVLLTGIHLMRTGEVEANLVRLNEDARLSHVHDLIAASSRVRRRPSSPKAMSFHRRDRRLQAVLEQAHL